MSYQTNPVQPSSQPLPTNIILKRWLWLGVIALIISVLVKTTISTQQLQDTLYAAALGFGATLLGAVFLLTPGRHHVRCLNLALSISGGMMLAAAIFSLLLPASELLRQERFVAQWQILLACTVFLGAVLMSLLEKYVPHSHPVAGDSAAGYRQSSRLWLFVYAIALHNIPEGLAVGVSFASGNPLLGQSVSLAIALQDFPEGFAMAMVLLKLGVRPLQAFGWSLLAAALEPVAAVIALVLSNSLNTTLALANPLALALAAGAMFFVVIHEVIPETHSAHVSHSSRWNTMLFLTGFLLLWLLDSALA
jgi:ZIP family zinc transporter